AERFPPTGGSLSSGARRNGNKKGAANCTPRPGRITGRAHQVPFARHAGLYAVNPEWLATGNKRKIGDLPGCVRLRVTRIAPGRLLSAIITPVPLSNTR